MKAVLVKSHEALGEPHERCFSRVMKGVPVEPHERIFRTS